MEIAFAMSIIKCFECKILHAKEVVIAKTVRSFGSPKVKKKYDVCFSLTKSAKFSDSHQSAAYYFIASNERIHRVNNSHVFYDYDVSELI